MNLTREQTAIVGATPERGSQIVVKAFAGTGKTFTLERYAEARPTSKMLYAAFNKAIQLEAERKMPGNVLSKTTHSLAWRAIGCEYQRAGKLEASVPVWRVARYLGAHIIVANFVMEVVESFMASALPQITELHIPGHVISYFVSDNKPIPPFVDMANGVWKSMCSFAPNSIPMVHDGYLKLWQLSQPVIDFEYIMLDEAQDTTPCVWDIISKQNARKIVVGDTHQAIYGWRGAIDAMEQLGECDTYYLTQSFRFGPAVADLASTLLKRFKGEKKELRGSENLKTTISTGGVTKKRTVLARGNSLIFKSSAHEVEHTRSRLGYVGGDHRSYRFYLYADVYNLYIGDKDRVKDIIVKSFDNYEEMKNYAEKCNRVELSGACVVVEEYKGKIPSILRKVKDRDVGANFADLRYATGHKSKGLEFPVVQMASDFWGAVEFHREVAGDGVVPDDELNLIYVAMTRATKELYIPQELKTWIEEGENKPKDRIQQLFNRLKAMQDNKSPDVSERSSRAKNPFGMSLDALNKKLSSLSR